VAGVEGVLQDHREDRRADRSAEALKDVDRRRRARIAACETVRYAAANSAGKGWRGAIESESLPASDFEWKTSSRWRPVVGRPSSPP
jgi:hypothetical protein